MNRTNLKKYNSGREESEQMTIQNQRNLKKDLSEKDESEK